MFDLSEDELTWDVVGKWTTKDSDLDYSTIVKYQPMTRMDTLIGSSFYPEGKHYRIRVMYFLKDTHLFIATLRSGCDAKDFQSKSLIDLSHCSLMTEPVISRKPPGFLSTSDRASFSGERFFFEKASGSGLQSELPPSQLAFTLRYPESQCYYNWEDAFKFSAAIKRRIHLSNLESE